MKGSGRHLTYVPAESISSIVYEQDTYERGLFDVIQCGRHLEM